jgi:hypothetical protein
MAPVSSRVRARRRSSSVVASTSTRTWLEWDSPGFEYDSQVPTPHVEHDSLGQALLAAVAHRS